MDRKKQEFEYDQEIEYDEEIEYDGESDYDEGFEYDEDNGYDEEYEYDDEYEDIVEEKRGGKGQQDIIINIKNHAKWPLLLLLVAAVVVTLLIVKSGQEKDKPPTITSDSDLMRIMKMSQLSSYKFAYNGIAEKKDDKKTVYYVKYNSTVKAGIDINKIKYRRDDSKKILYVKLPNAEIEKPNVDFDSQRYIFKDKDSNNRYTAIDSYPVCENDVKKETKKYRKDIIKTANNNAKDIVKALLEPLAQQENYVVKVKTRRVK